MATCPAGILPAWWGRACPVARPGWASSIALGASQRATRQLKRNRFIGRERMGSKTKPGVGAGRRNPVAEPAPQGRPRPLIKTPSYPAGSAGTPAVAQKPARPIRYPWLTNTKACLVRHCLPAGGRAQSTCADWARKILRFSLVFRILYYLWPTPLRFPPPAFGPAPGTQPSAPRATQSSYPRRQTHSFRFKLNRPQPRPG